MRRSLVRTVTTAAAVSALLVVSACGDDDPGGSGDTSGASSAEDAGEDAGEGADDGEGEAGEEVAPGGDGASGEQGGEADAGEEVAGEGSDDGPEPGGLDDPVAVGELFEVAEQWEIVAEPTVLDATDLVLGENEFNEEPVEGRRFVMATLTVTYIGDDSGSPFDDLFIEFAGPDGDTFGYSSEEDYCGVVPGDLDDADEVASGESIEGTVCASVPEDQIEGGAWVVDDLTGVSYERIAVAVD